MLLVGAGDNRPGVGVLQGLAELPVLQVAGAGAHRIEVEALDDDALAAHVAQVAVLDHLQDVEGEDDLLPDLGEAAVRAGHGRGEPGDGQPAPGAEVFQDGHVAGGGGVVAFVDDDDADVPDGFAAPLDGQGLDGGDDDVDVLVLVAFGLDDADAQVGADGADLGGGLVKEFLAVGDDQGALAVELGQELADQVGEDDGLAGAGGEDHGEPVAGALPSGYQGLDRVALVGTRGEHLGHFTHDGHLGSSLRGSAGMLRGCLRGCCGSSKPALSWPSAGFAGICGMFGGSSRIGTGIFRVDASRCVLRVPCVSRSLYG